MSLGDSVTSPPLPPVAVPESVSVCEPEGYVTVTDPVLAPAVNGANSTYTVQLLFAGSAEGQLLVCTKSAVAVMLLIATGVDPLFLSKAPCVGLVSPMAVLANVSDVGEKVSPPTASTAVPESATLCGLLGSLSMTVRLSVLDPADRGLNVTAMVHDAPPTSVAGDTGHVVELTAYGEPAVIEEMVSGLDARFDSVTVCAGDVWPTVMLLHDKADGERDTPGPPPVAVPESGSANEPEGYVTVTDPDFAPEVDGSNTTFRVQLAFAASVAGQLFV